MALKFYLCRLHTRTCVHLADSLATYLMDQHVRSKHTVKAPPTSLVEIVAPQGLRGQRPQSHEVTLVQSPPDGTSPWPPSHVASMSWFRNGHYGPGSSRPMTLGAQSHIAGAGWSTPTGSWVRRTGRPLSSPRSPARPPACPRCSPSGAHVP